MPSDTEITPQDNHTLVRPGGPRLDAASAPALKNTVIDLANQGNHRVVISASQLQHIDSSGLGALIALHKTLQSAGGRLVLCDVSAKVMPVLKLTRLDRVLSITDDPAAAAALLGSG